MNDADPVAFVGMDGTLLGYGPYTGMKEAWRVVSARRDYLARACRRYKSTGASPGHRGVRLCNLCLAEFVVEDGNLPYGSFEVGF